MPSRLLSFHCCWVLGLLMLSACSGSKPAADPETRAVSVDVNAFLQNALEATPTFSYDELVAQLGDPVRVKAARAGADGAQARDTLRTLIYYGLELGLHEGATSSRLAYFALTDARYTSPEGLRVGYAESQVLSALGLPTRREPAQLIYEQDDTRPYTLMVLLERRAVSRLEWRLVQP